MGNRTTNRNGYDLAKLVNSSEARVIDTRRLRAEFEQQIEDRINELHEAYFRELVNAIDANRVSIAEVARRTGYSRKTIYDHLDHGRRLVSGRAIISVGGFELPVMPQNQGELNPDFVLLSDHQRPLGIDYDVNMVGYQDGPIVRVMFSSPHTPPGAPDNFTPVTGQVDIQLFSLMGSPDPAVESMPDSAKKKFSFRVLEGEGPLAAAAKGPVIRAGSVAAEVFAWLTA